MDGRGTICLVLAENKCHIVNCLQADWLYLEWTTKAALDGGILKLIWGSWSGRQKRRGRS